MAKISRAYDLAGVYLIRNKHNGKVYIGSSADMVDRFAQHKRSLEKGCHSNRPMQNDFNSGHSFEFDILYVVPLKRHRGHTIRDHLHGMELKFIEEFDAINSGYNIQPVHEGYRRQVI